MGPAINITNIPGIYCVQTYMYEGHLGAFLFMLISFKLPHFESNFRQMLTFALSCPRYTKHSI